MHVNLNLRLVLRPLHLHPYLYPYHPHQSYLSHYHSLVPAMTVQANELCVLFVLLPFVRFVASSILNVGRKISTWIISPAAVTKNQMVVGTNSLISFRWEEFIRWDIYIYVK